MRLAPLFIFIHLFIYFSFPGEEHQEVTEVRIHLCRQFSMSFSKFELQASEERLMASLTMTNEPKSRREQFRHL